VLFCCFVSAGSWFCCWRHG